MEILSHIIGFIGVCAFFVAIASLFGPKITLYFMPMHNRTRTIGFFFYTTISIACIMSANKIKNINISVPTSKYVMVKQKIAEETVSAWIKANIDRPETYNPVSFEKLKVVSAEQSYTIQHKYLARDSAGTLTFYDETFLLDGTCTTVDAHGSIDKETGSTSTNYSTQPKKASKQETAENTVRAWMKANAYDPDSYDPISFGTLQVVSPDYAYTIQHKYRARNGFGALMLYDETFFLDGTCTIVGAHGPTDNK